MTATARSLMPESHPVDGASTIVFDRLDEAGVSRLAEDVAALLLQGDLVALGGDLGAGKSVFARALIRYLAADDGLEVPSPTFPLRLDYRVARMEVVHADLYRIGASEGVAELALDEALEAGVVLVEWPDRAALPSAAGRLDVILSGAGERRTVHVSGTQTWHPRLARLLRARHLIANAGYADARRSWVSGDVSGRAYRRLSRDGGSALLMDAPARVEGPPVHDGRSFEAVAHRALTVAPFVGIAAALRARGVHAPEILAADVPAGLVLVEDFGSGSIARDGRPVAERYEAAVDLLASIHAQGWPDAVALPGGGTHTIPPYDRDALLAELSLFPDCYAGVEAGPPFDESRRRAFLRAWSRVLGDLADARDCWVLLDFHSPNLMWRAWASGTDRIGVLDFQDALLGHCAYDLASLAQDVRVAMPAELEQHLKARYAMHRSAGGFDAEGFDSAYAIFAAQRATKVLGAFSRLANERGRTGYRRFLGNARAMLERSLSHPVLSPLKVWYQPYL